jgi:hypothetical protein
MTYNPGTGRFLSLDPLAGHLEDPQSLNKYDYARNDPINLDDPSGQDFLGVGIGIAIGATMMADPEGFLPPNSVTRSVLRAGSPTLADYYARLEDVKKKYQTMRPELYKAMGFDKFFPTLIDIAKRQVVRVTYDPEPLFGGGADAEYHPVWNSLTVTQPTMNLVSEFSIVHESVHAWDDNADWYLNFSYLANRRKAEALGYGIEYMMECFNDLNGMFVAKRTLSPEQFSQRWSNFWKPFLHDGTRDKRVYVGGVDKGMLTNDDLADLKAKVGVYIDYDKIAPLFGNPPKP